MEHKKMGMTEAEGRGLILFLIALPLGVLYLIYRVDELN